MIGEYRYDYLSASLQDIIRSLSSGSGSDGITSVSLVREYLRRIEANNQKGLELRAVIETAPWESSGDGKVVGLREIAEERDRERAEGNLRGALHGVPVLVKDMIATDGSLGMRTTGGSHALLKSTPPRDAHLVHLLRENGAIILGKSNMTQFTNLESNRKNGYSSRGGQTLSAYVRPEAEGGWEDTRDPAGSSSGSAVALSVGWCAASIGVETGGSVVLPAARAALYALKPTVGFISRAGIIPTSLIQDSPGVMGKSAWDVACMLNVIKGVDARDPATSGSDGQLHEDYTKFVSADFKGLRLGISRKLFWDARKNKQPKEVYDAMEEAIVKIRNAGAEVVDPADLPSAHELSQLGITNMAGSYTACLVDFKLDLIEYLSECDGPVKTLADIVEFNRAHPELELPRGEASHARLVKMLNNTDDRNSELYQQAVKANLSLSRTNGIDAVLTKDSLDVLLLPTESYAPLPTALARYPIATVPLGYRNNGMPFGMAVVGGAWAEKNLLRVMGAWEGLIREEGGRRAPGLEELR